MRGPVEVAPGVHGLGSELINWYLVVDGGRITAIDAGLPGFARSLEDDLRAIGHSVSNVAAVVLTHSDSDHTGIAPRLREAGARVLVHEADEASLRNPGPKGGDASPRHLLANAWRPFAIRIMAHSIRHGAKPAKVEGAETFRDGDVLDVPGRPRAVHTPGHTPGHCVLLLEDRGVLFAGDALIAHDLITKGDGIGVMPRFFNTDDEQMRASLGVIERLEADTVLFGHGEPWRDGTKAAVASARAKGR